MTQLEFLMCLRDKRAEAIDIMNLTLKNKNYIALRYWLNEYFTYNARIEAAEKLLKLDPTPTIWGAKQSPPY